MITEILQSQYITEFSPETPPVVEIFSGDEIHAQIMDWCFNELGNGTRTYQRTCQTPRCPAAGPIAIKGAKPGDTLAVKILDIKPHSPGTMAFRPGCGPLGMNIKEIQVFSIPLQEKFALLPNGRKIPLTPMLGVIGTAPEKGKILTTMAGDHGGNLDTKEVCKESTIYLPVSIEGGLLAFGDVHASMGDGELSGTGIEVSATVKIRVNLISESTIVRPRIETPSEIITVATSEKIEHAVELVSGDMINWLMNKFNMSFRDALLLVGTLGSLRFSQVVNKPGPTVKLVLEKSNIK